MKKLEPVACPFCGSAKVNVLDGSTFRWLVAGCADCGAMAGEVRVQTVGDGTATEWRKNGEQDAIAEWNKRAIPAKEQTK